MRTILNIPKLQKGNFEWEKHEKGQFWKGRPEHTKKENQ